MSDARKKAVQLLRKYDEAKRKLNELERELDAACLDYGKAQRMAWFSKDNLRTILIVEQEQKAKLDRKADEHEWERSHG